MTLMICGSTLEEAVYAMDSLFANEKCSFVECQMRQTEQFFSDGMEIRLGNISLTNANAVVHFDHDFRSVLVPHTFKIIQKCFYLACNVPIPSAVVLKVVK